MLMIRAFLFRLFRRNCNYTLTHYNRPAVEVMKMSVVKRYYSSCSQLIFF